MTTEPQDDTLLPPEPDGVEPVVSGPLFPAAGPDAGLPDELDRLGDQLERAARSSLRRRNRRGQFIQSIAIALLAVPIAIGFSSTDLAPSESLRVQAADAATEPAARPSLGFRVAYIPDEPALWAAPKSCLDGRDCTISVKPDHTITALEGKL